MSNRNDKTCFVIAPIGEPESRPRARSDVVLRHLIQPAAEACGLERVLRADQIDKSGFITTQVVDQVLHADVVVADLTDQNPNVFYELAIRHAIRKPVVHLIGDEQDIPFDVSHNRAIPYDTADWGSLETARSQLIAQIGGMLDGSTAAQNPISVTLDLLALRQSDRPIDQQLADIKTELSELRAGQIRTSNPTERIVARLNSLFFRTEHDREASIKNTLRGLLTAQEAHLADHDRYATNLRDLQFLHVPGVVVELVDADDRAWNARAWHQQAPSVSFGISVGRGPAANETIPEGVPTQIG